MRSWIKCPAKQQNIANLLKVSANVYTEKFVCLLSSSICQYSFPVTYNAIARWLEHLPEAARIHWTQYPVSVKTKVVRAPPEMVSVVESTRRTRFNLVSFSSAVSSVSNTLKIYTSPACYQKENAMATLANHFAFNGIPFGDVQSWSWTRRWVDNQKLGFSVKVWQNHSRWDLPFHRCALLLGKTYCPTEIRRWGSNAKVFDVNAFELSQSTAKLARQILTKGG